MKVALAFAERSNDRRPGISGTQCRGFEGNVKNGFRHISWSAKRRAAAARRRTCG
jgi:hypothetical protein